MALSSSFGASSPFSSASFFLASALAASSAFFLLGSFQSLCLLRHSCSVFVHFAHSSLNHLPAWISSTRCVSFLAKIQSFSSLVESASDCHAYTTPSKPSSF